MTLLHQKVLVELTVDVQINDHAGVIERYLNGGELHGEHPYGLDTQDEILHHLAYNATVNGIAQANRLDGWADLADDAATMTVIPWATEMETVR